VEFVKEAKKNRVRVEAYDGGCGKWMGDESRVKTEPRRIKE
jgi:hypothetical protein